MSARILEGKVFAQAFREDAQKKAAALFEQYGVQPGLAVIIVGSNPASQVYVRNKHKSCEALGIYSEVIEMPETTTKDELIAKIDALNADPKIHGILVQLPLPEQIAAHESEILERIRPEKDVDGFHPVNVGRLVTGQPGLVPCTPFGCLRMLELAGIPIDGQRAVIIGRSNIVGKPMLHLLLGKNATVTICHSHTKDLPAVTREADILVAAVGRPNFVTADMVKPGAEEARRRRRLRGCQRGRRCHHAGPRRRRSPDRCHAYGKCCPRCRDAAAGLTYIVFLIECRRYRNENRC